MSIDSKNNQYTMAEVKEFGERFHNYMNESNAPGCTVPPITFTLASLDGPAWSSEYRPKRLQSEHEEMIRTLGLPIESDSGIEHSQSQYRYVWITNLVTWTEWCGHIGPGVVFMDLVIRNRQAGDPRLTDMTKAIYETSYPIDTLKHIFFCDVVNSEARRIIENQVIKRMFRPRAITSYEVESDQFKLILGTELGRFVARLILGTWGQGVKRVERVTVMAHLPQKTLSDLRFDIGDCP
ncbi:hypothetical protein N7509_011573 [Penicillium cosmopolitanum]|uniref:Uncharacterized protein n=1 Tax=Penicillium cosmopolitanum TaxID=1131564 RepID=A0A9W9SJJ0_9EURO|nr:uncharacterized protein N7509_011573 [Penicillium cosmopolitanum]KAJ5378454.1 hypothetical protein N7509_011573 [Penicillium cosmopolitanum]